MNLLKSIGLTIWAFLEGIAISFLVGIKSFFVCLFIVIALTLSVIGGIVAWAFSLLLLPFICVCDFWKKR